MSQNSNSSGQDSIQQDDSVTGMMRTLLGANPDTLDCHAAAEIVVMLVKRLDPTLDLSDMAGWKIVDDLSVGAQELSGEVGHEINPTNRELGSATARVVQTEKGSIVLVESSLFRKLITGPDGDATLAINVLHHELCHVHDAEVRKRMPWWQGKIGDDLRMRVLLPPLVRLFDEYSANRRSVKTIPSWFEIAQAKLLAQEWENIRDAVSAAVQGYHAHQDLHRLMAEVGEELGYLFQLLGYVLGTAAGKGKTFENTDPESYEVISNSWLAPMLFAGVRELDTLYETFGAWQDQEVFQDLADVAAEVYEDAGVKLMTWPDGSLTVKVAEPLTDPD